MVIFHNDVNVYQRLDLHFPMVFPRFSRFPMGFLGFSHVPMDFPLILLGFSHFPRDLPMVNGAQSVLAHLDGNLEATILPWRGVNIGFSMDFPIFLGDEM